jgi:hypothetical protein
MKASLAVATCCLTMLGGCTGSEKPLAPQPLEGGSHRISAACTERPETYLRVDFNTGPLHFSLQLHRARWIEFIGATGWKWTDPQAADPSMLTVAPILRCGNGLVLARLEGRHPGQVSIEAALKPTPPVGTRPIRVWRASAHIVR